MEYTIHSDHDAISPRENNNLGTIAYCSNRYLLGDQQVTWNQLYKLIKDRDKIGIPVYAYIHGGVTINTTGFSCGWDSGLVGYIYVSKDKVRSEFSVKNLSSKLKGQVLEVLKAEIEEFDNYLTGEVYGYDIVDNGQVIDACWGFYGKEAVIMAAEESLKYWERAA